jgi:stage II sporulation protein D
MGSASQFSHRSRSVRARLGALAAAAAAAALALLAAPAAHGASLFVISGGGDGHGVGMSQYGALGMAQHGYDHGAILAHYYQGTSLGSSSSPHTVTVLLRTGSAAFSGSDSSVGSKHLDPTTDYSVTSAGGGELSLDAKGSKPLGPFPAPLTIHGTGPLHVNGLGTYRGSLEFWPSGRGVQTVNAVDLEDYVRGVISAEVPSSWPAQALEAQADAARTFAIAAQPVNPHFDLYPDTRSQMYTGIAAETSATDAAVAATKGEIVTYHGQPVVTYFFASSGGHTESIQNEWPGSTPEPYLVGVPDPFDSAGPDPYHRWTVNLGLRAAMGKLGNLVKGSLIGIRVSKHGVSPRVVTAEVVGSGGTTTVTGLQLQRRFNLMSTYMSFATITASSGAGSGGSAGGAGGSAGAAGSAGGSGSGSGTGSGTGSPSGSGAGGTGTASGGTGLGARTTWGALALGSYSRRVLNAKPRRARRAASTPRRLAIHGTIFPVMSRTGVTIQQLTTRGWVAAGVARLSAAGAFSMTLTAAGRYRVVYGAIDGPSVNVSAS